MRDRRTFLLPLVLVVVTTLGVLAYATRAFEGLERDSINQRFGRARRPDTAAAISSSCRSTTRPSASCGCSGRFRARCTRRSSTASDADRPKVIAYDVQFSEASAPRLVQLASSRTAAILKLTRPKVRRALTRIGDEDDLDLANAILDSGGRTVLSFTETNAQGPGEPARRRTGPA